MPTTINFDLKRYPVIATSMGAFALFLWSLSALLLTYLSSLPFMQVLLTNLIVSSILILGKVAIMGEWYKLKQPWYIWAMGVIGIYGNDLCYLGAFRHAPAAEVELLSYLWPIFTLFFLPLLPSERFSLRSVFVAIIAFTGCAILLLGGGNFELFNTQHLLGYGIITVGALIWAIYCVLSRHFNETPVEMIGVYCAVGAAISLLHILQWGSFVMPSHTQWAIMIFMGCTSIGPAFMLWDRGMKYGNIKLLSVFSYYVPIVSVSLLIAFHKVQFNLALVVGGSMVVFAAPLMKILSNGYDKWRASSLEDKLLVPLPD